MRDLPFPCLAALAVVAAACGSSVATTSGAGSSSHASASSSSGGGAPPSATSTGGATGGAGGTPTTASESASSTGGTSSASTSSFSSSNTSSSSSSSSTASSSSASVTSSSSSSSSSSSGLAPDAGPLVCSIDGGGACATCCAEQDPDGVTALLGFGEACICAPSGCENECSGFCAAADGGALDAGELGDGGVFGTGACETCVNALLKSQDQCITLALVKCEKDASCKAFLGCDSSCGM